MGDLQPAPSALAPVAAPFARSPMRRDAVAGVQRGAGAPTSLKILHILRAPLGGLFRHVVDLVHGQAERGHRVGLIVDSTTGGARAEALLAELAPRLALGFTRIPITRQLHLRDIEALRVVSQRISTLGPDVLHGHGAKGAALARLTPNAQHAIRVYTPHGGSLVYCPGTVSGSFYRGLEWLLNWRTDLFLFESTYIADLFRTKIGRPRAMVRVVRNGIGEAEFEPVTPRADVTDIVCVGELRPVKAIDVLIEALSILRQSGRKVTATIAGEGPENAKLIAQTQRLGLTDQIHFIGHCPAREAFSMGRIFVIPSRAESLPYVMLEAAAAGLPIIGSEVGGMPEIFGSQAGHLIPSDDVAALVGAISTALDDPARGERVAQAVRARVRSKFSVGSMVDDGLTAYREALAVKRMNSLSPLADNG